MEEDEEILPRSAPEVAQRVLGLLAVIGKVHFPERNLEWIETESVSQYLTPIEKEFINNEKPLEQDWEVFSWKAEALVSLLWSLKGISEMPPLNKQFEAYSNDMVITAVRKTQIFLSEATIRSEEELDKMESFLYHQHWRIRDKELGLGMDQPSEDDPDISLLDSGIVFERRYGMSWVVGFGDSWDDVPTDT